MLIETTLTHRCDCGRMLTLPTNGSTPLRCDCGRAYRLRLWLDSWAAPLPGCPLATDARVRH